MKAQAVFLWLQNAGELLGLLFQLGLTAIALAIAGWMVAKTIRAAQNRKEAELFESAERIARASARAKARAVVMS